MTHATILGPEILLAGAEPANHAVGVLVRMVGCEVVTPVAGEDFGAAREPEPAVRFGVMFAVASVGERFAGDDAELLLGRFAARRQRASRCAADEEEFRVGDFEC